MKNSVSARLSERTAPEVAAAIYEPSLLNFSAAALERMCALNEAHVVMLQARGLITTDIARTILAAIARIRTEGPEAIDLDPQFEESYFAFENRLSQITGKGVAGWLHIGRSRNDIGSTLDRMQLRETCLALLEGMQTAMEAGLDAALRHVDVVMPGYTHMQPAQPITLGYYFLNAVSALERDLMRMAAVYDRADCCALGSAAFAGTSFDIDREDTAALLGFQNIAVPALDAVASRDFVTELLWAVTSAQTLLSRVAQDLYAFSTYEFAAISFPDSIAGTSSIMPQKKNMLPLEYFRAEAGRSIGALAGTLSAIKGSNFSIGLDSVREGIADAWPAFDRFQVGLPLLRLLFEKATPATERLAERCVANFSTATDLADALVKHHGLSFREAHHVVGHAVQAVIAHGGDATGLTAAVVNEAAGAEVGRRFELDDETIRNWMEPRAAVRARRTMGGPAPEEVQRIAAELRTRLAAVADQRRSHADRLRNAREELRHRVKQIHA
jgi:argininosuccinate lyase